MKKMNYVSFLLGVAALATLAPVSGSAAINQEVKIKGTVGNFTAEVVTIKNADGEIKVPRKAVRAKDIRPGQKVEAKLQLAKLFEMNK